MIHQGPGLWYKILKDEDVHPGDTFLNINFAVEKTDDPECEGDKPCEYKDFPFKGDHYKFIGCNLLNMKLTKEHEVEDCLHAEVKWSVKGYDEGIGPDGKLHKWKIWGNKFEKKLHQKPLDKVHKKVAVEEMKRLREEKKLTKPNVERYYKELGLDIKDI